MSTIVERCSAKLEVSVDLPVMGALDLAFVIKNRTHAKGVVRIVCRFVSNGLISVAVTLDRLIALTPRFLRRIAG